MSTAVDSKKKEAMEAQAEIGPSAVFLANKKHITDSIASISTIREVTEGNRASETTLT